MPLLSLSVYSDIHAETKERWVISKTHCLLKFRGLQRRANKNQSLFEMSREVKRISVAPLFEQMKMLKSGYVYIKG